MHGSLVIPYFRIVIKITYFLLRLEEQTQHSITQSPWAQGSKPSLQFPPSAQDLCTISPTLSSVNAEVPLYTGNERGNLPCQSQDVPLDVLYPSSLLFHLPLSPSPAPNSHHTQCQHMGELAAIPDSTSLPVCGEQPFPWEELPGSCCAAAWF